METNVPYIVHESEVARLERINKRLWILVFVLIILLVATNGIWIWYESQFMDEVTAVEQEVETDSGNAFVTGIGDITYGENTADGNKENQNP